MEKIWYLNRTTMRAELVLKKIGLLQSFALPPFTQCYQKTHISKTFARDSSPMSVYLPVGEHSHGLCTIATEIIVRYNCNSEKNQSIRY